MVFSECRQPNLDNKKFQWKKKWQNKIMHACVKKPLVHIAILSVIDLTSTPHHPPPRLCPSLFRQQTY